MAMEWNTYRRHRHRRNPSHCLNPDNRHCPSSSSTFCKIDGRLTDHVVFVFVERAKHWIWRDSDLIYQSKLSNPLNHMIKYTLWNMSAGVINTLAKLFNAPSRVTLRWNIYQQINAAREIDRKFVGQIPPLQMRTRFCINIRKTHKMSESPLISGYLRNACTRVHAFFKIGGEIFETRACVHANFHHSVSNLRKACVQTQFSFRMESFQSKCQLWWQSIAN